MYSDEQARCAASGDYDEFDSVTVPARRSTSLKTGKSPPVASARRKKEVRFADALGLDLESVKHIMNTSEPPIVPASAHKHLLVRSESAGEFAPAPYRRRLLHACFSQPAMSRNFAERVAERRVSLETCLVAPDSIDGVVRVANLAFEKHVVVRYTLNGWLTFSDVRASYVHGSSNGGTDQFRFSIALPHTFGIIGNAVEFSIKFEAGGSAGDCVYWDSNYGANYRVECYISWECHRTVYCDLSSPADLGHVRFSLSQAENNMAFFIDNQTPVVVDLLAHLLYLNVSHVTGSTTFWCQLSVNCHGYVHDTHWMLMLFWFAELEFFIDRLVAWRTPSYLETTASYDNTTDDPVTSWGGDLTQIKNVLH